MEYYTKPHEEEDVDKEKTPFDNIFGRKIVRKIKAKGSYVEKLSLTEFKNLVNWENSLNYPEFIMDLIQYLTCLNVREYLQVKLMRDQEDRDVENYKLQV